MVVRTDPVVVTLREISSVVDDRPNGATHDRLMEPVSGRDGRKHIPEPTVQAASVRLSLALCFVQDRYVLLTEDSVVVMDQKLGTLSPGCRVSNLLLHPGKARIFGHAEMNDLAAETFHDDKHIDRNEEERVLDQKITTPDGRSLVFQKRRPCLCAPRTRLRFHAIFLNRALCVPDPEVVP